MKSSGLIKALWLGALVFCVCQSYGQKGVFKPFKVVIITPDTAFIDASLHTYVDTVLQEEIKTYQERIRVNERIAAETTYRENETFTKRQWEEMKDEAKKAADYAKAHRAEVEAFQYYEIIPEYSASVFEYYFNEYPPFSTIMLIGKSGVSKERMAFLADSLKADYVVGYKNIHTGKTDSGLIVKLTTLLYSRAGDKLLLEKETTGDTNSYGDMWTCDNPLSCLMITAVRSSTEAVAPILAKRQMKDGAKIEK